MTSLDLGGCRLGELGDVGIQTLLDALQGNTHLRSLECGSKEIKHSAALLTAVTGHATLQHLGLAFNKVDVTRRRSFGIALSALLAAHPSALSSLDVAGCELSDEGLRPLVEALPGAAHLRILSCGFNGMTDGFTASLLTAVRVNTSLRELWVVDDEDEEANQAIRTLAHAEAVVAARQRSTRSALR